MKSLSQGCDDRKSINDVTQTSKDNKKRSRGCAWFDDLEYIRINFSIHCRVVQDSTRLIMSGIPPQAFHEMGMSGNRIPKLVFDATQMIFSAIPIIFVASFADE